MLTLTDLHTYYGDSYILQGLSLELEPGEVVHLADLMADREAQIPQRMQDCAHPAFFRGSDLAVEQEEDVDVRLQAELPPAVAAERDDEAGVPGGRVGEQA